MGRIRTIKPEFFRSRSLARCPLAARMTFAGLWTEADDHGRGVADPRILKGALWALDDDVTHLHVSAHLDVLNETGHIHLYESDGETYYEIANWSDHQAAAYRRGEAKYPAPDGYLAPVSHLRMQESADDTQAGAGSGRELEGKGKTVAADADDCDETFEQFWQQYPRGPAGKPGGDGPKKPAAQKWRRLSDAEREACLIAVKHYADDLKRPDAPNAAHATTWLNQERWETWQEPAEPFEDQSVAALLGIRGYQ